MKRPQKILLMLSMVAVAVTMPVACSRPEQKVETRTVVVGPPVEQGNANSSDPAISSDGRYVAFTSEATNLLKTSTFGRNVFIREVETGVTTLVSATAAGIEGNGDSEQPAVSGDGALVAFASEASDLVAADTNEVCTNAGGLTMNCKDVFLKDIAAGTVTIASVDVAGNQGDGISQQPALSASGRFVAFTSFAANFAPEDANGTADVFLKDIESGALTLVSGDADGVPGNGESGRPSISADGRFVAFQSHAGNLAGADNNGASDVFIKDTQTGALALVSADADGVPGNKASGLEALALSADGRFVIFESEADNLVGGDANGKRDVFIKDTQTGAIAVVSTDGAGVQGEDDSYASVAISADGAMAFFSSNADNLTAADTVNKTDIFRKDTQTGLVDLIATDSAGVPGDGASERLAATPDGLMVAFSSAAASLVADDANKKTDIFFKDLRTGETIIISTSSA